MVVGLSQRISNFVFAVETISTFQWQSICPVFFSLSIFTLSRHALGFPKYSIAENVSTFIAFKLRFTHYCTSKSQRCRFWTENRFLFSMSRRRHIDLGQNLTRKCEFNISIGIARKTDFELHFEFYIILMVWIWTCAQTRRFYWRWTSDRRNKNWRRF